MWAPDVMVDAGQAGYPLNVTSSAAPQQLNADPPALVTMASDPQLLQRSRFPLAASVPPVASELMSAPSTCGGPGRVNGRPPRRERYPVHYNDVHELGQVLLHTDSSCTTTAFPRTRPSARAVRAAGVSTSAYRSP